ncbi:MAG: bifunctional nuclease family protein [Treponema sp.]|jgi:bifunctional DNase/RNase|nr:bifunctional nuclease family protein [Treponema sp.]
MNDMLKAEIWTIARTDQGNAVLLRPLGSNVSVPIFIGPLETQYILIGGGEIPVKRPLTPDLFLSLVKHVGLELRRVEIHELKNDTFHARLVLSGGEYTGRETLILDSRPSDAFALAVRKKSPIYVARKVVEQAGIPVDMVMSEMEETLNSTDRAGSPVVSKREGLLAELEKAVEAEEYERAAEIRDMLLLLNKEDEGNRLNCQSE